MSTKMESVVRPFETRRVTPARRALTAYEKSDEKVVLRIGAGGSGKTMNGSFSQTQNAYMDTKLKEQSLQDAGFGENPAFGGF